MKPSFLKIFSRTNVAMALTIIWVVFWVATICLESENFNSLSFNEVGDFLAGIFGPVAFLWLVIGYFQQGEELRLQVKELANSVRQQAEMVSVTRDSLEHERNSAAKAHASRQKALEPDLVITYAPMMKSGVDFHFKLRINNVGAQVSRFQFILFDGAETHLQLSETLFTNGKTVERDGNKGELPPEKLSATAQFTNSEGISNVWQYEFLRTSKSSGWREYTIVRKINNPSA